VSAPGKKKIEKKKHAIRKRKVNGCEGGCVTTGLLKKDDKAEGGIVLEGLPLGKLWEKCGRSDGKKEGKKNRLP